MQLTLKHPPTILTVDDCIITQKVLKKVLGSGYRVISAENAVDALLTIYQQPVDLLVLDVSMPDIDGLELCRTLRQMPKFDRIPIIMLTSRDSTFDKVQGLMAGATEYLTKPLDVEYLCGLVERLIGTPESKNGCN